MRIGDEPRPTCPSAVYPTAGGPPGLRPPPRLPRAGWPPSKRIHLLHSPEGSLKTIRSDVRESQSDVRVERMVAEQKNRRESIHLNRIGYRRDSD